MYGDPIGPPTPQDLILLIGLGGIALAFIMATLAFAISILLSIFRHLHL